MPRGNQLARQWQLLQLLDRPAGLTVDEAAQVLGCAVRTIWRDLRVLQDAGFPLYDEPAPDGRHGLWKVQEAFRARLPLKLSLAELAALLMSRDLLAPLGADILGEAVTGAFQKIAGVLSRDALAYLDRMRDTIGVRALGAKLQLPVAAYLPAIHTALLEHRTLRIRYYSPQRDAETERRVDPYHLTYFAGGLYLVAHCHLRRDVRIFAVERIRALAPTSQRFQRPADFDIEAYLGGAWGIVRGDLVTVKAVFAKTLARYIAERQWHPSQKLRELPDGRLEVTLRVADTWEVRRWLLGFGVGAEVVEPASMREALRAEVEALARRLTPLRAPLALAPSATTGARRSRPEPGLRAPGTV